MQTYIAEFHDVAKLLYKEDLRECGILIKGQHLDQVDFAALSITKPSSPSWFAQFSDEVKSLNSTRSKQCGDWAAHVFLTHIADEIASSFRPEEFEEHDEKKGRSESGYRKIWKGDIEDKNWSTFLVSDAQGFASLAGFIDSCKGHEEFLQSYAVALGKVPEDKAVPYNITSLGAHLTLVGKIFRVLLANTTPIQLESGAQQELGIKLGNKTVSQLTEAMGERIDRNDRGKWSAILALIRVNFRNHLTRLADLNVLTQRQRAIDEMKGTCGDHVLYATPDSLLLFLPVGGLRTLDDLLSPLVEKGFDLQVEELEAEMGLLVSNFERGREKYVEKRKKVEREGRRFSRNLALRKYPKSRTNDWPEYFNGKLCEVCQSRPARSEPWVKDRISEWLCCICAGLRDLHNPAREIAQWDDAVMWAKLSLDRGQLLKLLPQLFAQYVHETMPDLNQREVERFKEALRPLAVEVDFVNDYLQFTQQFQDDLVKHLSAAEDFEPIPWYYSLQGYYELFVCPVVSNREFLGACEIFDRLMEEWFPRCREDSPIQLSLSLSHAKHPYQEHWRFLTQYENEPTAPIRIQRANDIRFHINLGQIRASSKALSAPSAQVSSALHRLAAIDRQLQSPTATLFEALKDETLRDILKPLLFQHRLPIETILNFYKLTVWQELHRGS